MSLFNSDTKWSVMPEAQKLEIDVFFCGIGGIQDTILTLAKLQEAGFYVYYYAMTDGIKWSKGDSKHICSGEASLGITLYFMPEQTDFIERLYATLFNFEQNKNIDKKHWLNDYDQYGKIQVRHRINGGTWTVAVDQEDLT